MPTNDNIPEPCAGEIFFFVLYGPLYGLVCGFGLIGNSLSFGVLHKYSRNNVATYLLKALAVTDNLFLVTAALVQMYTAMVFYFDLVEQFVPIFPYLQTYAWPITHMVQMGTVWMMVLVAANRFIAVCMPLRAPQLCTKKNVQIQLVVLATTIVLYNTPRFFEYRYVYQNVTNERNETVLVEVNTGLTAHRLYNILYENVAYCMFVFFFPLLILVVLNAHLVRDLKKAQACRKALQGRGSKEENNITLVMIIIIIVFIICQTPASINQILYYMIADTEKTVCRAYTKFFHICNLLITLNSAMNFVIYCLFRRQFQQELIALLSRRGPRMAKRGHRKTLILRAVHESTSFRSTRDPLRSNNLEAVPLRDSCCHDNVNFRQDHHSSGFHEDNHVLGNPSSN
ncbi:hypothetical protein LSH36_146g04001 [Paralvinella palmiformis]|uniref:G-protein coupled receptors family 1 profile domain-containing protein n=1 Tax=Paralvinella palmiformis TaxID=53620 RepID=A0AAD9NA81_9ANNE|nr:hypothetical protein LSH36_146g04001 [Paralvinella palmiformis]